MKKVIAFPTSPWPLLIAMALKVVVFNPATIALLYLPDNPPASLTQEPASLTHAEEVQP
jgi:hypothetical protein